MHNPKKSKNLLFGEWKNLTGKRIYVLNIFETTHLPTHHPTQSCKPPRSRYSYCNDLAFHSAKKTGVGTNMRKTSSRKNGRISFFLKCWVEEFGYYWRCGKTKEVIHDKEPRYEETTLVSETGSGKTEPSLSLSCCSKPHIYHTATSPARKDSHRQPRRGAWFAQVTRWPWIPESGRSVGWKETLSWPLWL